MSGPRVPAEDRKMATGRKCPDCDGCGLSFRVFAVGMSETMVRGTCGTCSGSGEEPLTAEEQERKDAAEWGELLLTGRVSR